jgi:transcriptional regulator with XRE-family HTH domain
MARTPKPSVPMVIGRRIREHREALDLSQERLAEKAGLHRTYVGSVERGERNIAGENMVKLAHALGIDPGELLAGL